MSASFERFCLAAGARDAERDAGAGCDGGLWRAPRAGRSDARRIAGGGRRARSAFTAARSRSSARGFAGSTARSASCRVGRTPSAKTWLGKWAMNQMLINVSTRRFKRSVRLPEGDVPAPDGARAVEVGDLPPLRGVVGGAHEGVDGNQARRSRSAGDPDRRHSHGRGHAPRRGDRRRRERRQTSARPRRGRDRKRDDGAGAHRQSRRAWTRSNRADACSSSMARRRCPRRSAAPSDAMRRSSVARFTRRATFWSGCPNRCTPRCGASCGKPGKWTTPTRPKRSFAISPAVSNADWNGVSASILEGIDEMLTVTRLGLPRELRRSLACTNIIENVMGTVRRVCRNVKYWRSPSMALRWAAAAMQEAIKGFRRLKAYKHLPALRAALAKQGQQPPSDEALVQIAEAA